MKIEYDREVDALNIRLRNPKPEDSRDTEEGMIDLDSDGHIVGVEVLDASERLGLKSLRNVHIENIPLEKKKILISS